MDRKITLASPAKINLSLRIVGKRADGYHNLESLLQTIDLCDTLHLELCSKELPDQLTCTDSTLPTDQRNLVLKAASLFRKKTSLAFSVKAHLEKQIPHEAGLGGGSSNAATTLWGLNKLLGSVAKEQELLDWSAEIGSDIPFFFSKGTAFCAGRGEQVHDLPSISQRHPLWIIKPPVGLSTALVFQNFQENSSSPHSQVSFFNDLEASAFYILPQLAELKENLLSSHFETVVMTGAGSSFFCIGHGKPSVPNDHFCRQTSFINRLPNQWYIHREPKETYEAI